MKKNIGNVLALYPTPAVVVGTEVNGKVNWLLVAHVGIIGHDRIMLSLFKKHYTNDGVKQTGKVSVNMVNEAMLERADYVGCASGAKADKSDVFVYRRGEAGTPVIDESPLVMECEVIDNYETETFDNFICKITNTYVDEDCLNEKGKPDYDKLEVSAIGLGCMGFTQSYPPYPDRKDAIETIRKAMLTGRFNKDTKFDKTDFRSSIPRFQGENLKHNMELVEYVEDLAKKKETSPARIALGWLLAQKPWIVPIPGTKRIERIRK